MKLLQSKRVHNVPEGGLRRRMVLSFSIFILLIIVAIIGWAYFLKMPTNTPEGAGVRTPVRKVLNANESVFSGLNRQQTPSKTYPKSAAAKVPRVNGRAGLRNAADTTNWMLHVVRNPGDTILVSLADIKALPKTEIIFDFKCIEGWSQVTHWGGVRLRDFMAHYGLTRQVGMGYIGLVTPDKEYYVGIDMPSAMHDQTLLCYEVNDKPLPMDQGYPLRLIIPVKYGIKHLKRIGTMYFSNTRPADYWAERGYDYYSGL